MTEIGIRELKAHASEIVGAVRERRARYMITYRGRPVATLAPIELPLAGELGAESGADAWHDLVELGEEIARSWKAPEAGAELLSSMRR